MITAQQLESILHAEIPITQAMQIGVENCSDKDVSLSAPLAPNINHKQTAFGGSLYSVAVLAGWSMTYCLLERLGVNAQIVIHQSDINYLAPVAGTIEAHCQLTSEIDIEKFNKLMQRKGRARLKLKSHIIAEGKNAVEFEGVYVCIAH